MLAQNKRILAHLKSGKPITPLEALKRYGSLRLGARIWDLKRDGHNITRTMKRRGRRTFAEYRMGR